MQDRKKDIRQYNKNNQPHGHWEVYYPNTNHLWYTTYLVNGEQYGMTISDINILFYAR
jgi:antitoxin component YwqK of YwqJK toxin-antitoxin module